MRDKSARCSTPACPICTHVLRYLLRSSVQRWDSAVCTAQTAWLCVRAAGQLTGLPQIMCCQLADWLELFLETRAAGDEFNETDPVTRLTIHTSVFFKWNLNVWTSSNFESDFRFSHLIYQQTCQTCDWAQAHRCAILFSHILHPISRGPLRRFSLTLFQVWCHPCLSWLWWKFYWDCIN